MMRFVSKGDVIKEARALFCHNRNIYSLNNH